MQEDIEREVKSALKYTGNRRRGDAIKKKRKEKKSGIMDGKGEGAENTSYDCQVRYDTSCVREGRRKCVCVCVGERERLNHRQAEWCEERTGVEARQSGSKAALSDRNRKKKRKSQTDRPTHTHAQKKKREKTNTRMMTISGELGEGKIQRERETSSPQYT